MSLGTTHLTRKICFSLGSGSWLKWFNNKMRPENYSKKEKEKEKERVLVFSSKTRK